MHYALNEVYVLNSYVCAFNNPITVASKHLRTGQSHHLATTPGVGSMRLLTLPGEIPVWEGLARVEPVITRNTEGL